MRSIVLSIGWKKWSGIYENCLGGDAMKSWKNEGENYINIVPFCLGKNIFPQNLQHLIPLRIIPFKFCIISEQLKEHIF